MYMVKSNLSILNRIGINEINENNGIFVNTKQMHKHNVIFNKMVTKIATILKLQATLIEYNISQKIMHKI